jgi:hypothetical protein
MIATEESKDITVNGMKVTCYSDGSVEGHGKYRKPRSFGSVDSSNYNRKRINNSLYNVHDLIARAFLGNRPKGYDVDHINGNRADNRPSNLRYVTRSQNLRGHQKVRGKSKYRGVQVSAKNPKFLVKVGLGKEHQHKTKYLGSFTDEKEAAIARDKFCYEVMNYPLEGLNFPELFVDKKDTKPQVTPMQNNEENIERIQTQIDMIRQESRLLSYRIDRMTDQRKTLQDEKRKLKEVLIEYKNP